MGQPLKKALEARAKALGFDVVRVVRAENAPNRASELDTFLGQGHHGTMEWMADTAERRSHPQNLWPEVQSIIMLGMNYGPEENPLERLGQPDLGNISVYAQHRDYHDVIKGRLKELAGWLVAQTAKDVKVFVDTAPVMEKPLAEAAGLGWQGKHTNLVSREFGSWLFLGSIFSAALMEEDEKEVDHCGSCRACLDICPTKAFPAPYKLDARKCISYLTIEHKGPIPHDFRAAMGNRIYGCDDCLAVCPWNKFASAARELKLQPREEVRTAKLADLLELDDASFRTFFSGSPVKRIGVSRFLRNCLIAAGNSGNPLYHSKITGFLSHPEPLIRGAAVWALGKLAPQDVAGMAAQLCPQEEDQGVLEEWALAQKDVTVEEIK